MALPYPSMDFVPFDILTAEELDQVVANIEALAAGTGMNAGAIGPAQTTLIRTQTDNSNVIANAFLAGARFQAGWGQIAGSGTANAAGSVTFPDPFATLLFVLTGPIGAKVGSPAATIADLTTVHGSPVSVEPEDQSPTGFSFAYRLTSGTLGASDYHAFAWIAVGV